MSNKIIEAPEILKMLPHRHPFLLIDRVLDYEVSESLKAIKNVTHSEPHFTGHFPDHPVMPGVLIIEAMAQASGLLANLSFNANETGSRYYLVAVDKCRFRQPAIPGDTLEINISVKSPPKHNIWKIIAEASIEGKKIASAEIMCAARD